MPTLLQFLSLSSPPFGSNGTGISVVNIYLQADCSSWNNQWIGVGANIVGANQSAFYPSGNIHFLRVFISWLNLDLGIETCFFDGMDAYVKTWLQFVFPIYIWGVIALIMHVHQCTFS